MGGEKIVYFGSEGERISAEEARRQVEDAKEYQRAARERAAARRG